MRLHTACGIIVLSLLLASFQPELGRAEQARDLREAETAVTETLRVMGKASDRIVVGEEHLYVVSGVTRITKPNGALIDLDSLRTPCQAEVTYTRWMKGVKKAPVALHVHVVKEYPNASAFTPRE